MMSIKTIVGARETITVDRLMPVAGAAKIMAAGHVGAVPVLDGERLVGVFSERDILTRVVAEERDPRTTRVGDVMSSHLVVAGVDESYDTCLNRMQQAHVRHLLVLDGGRLAGMLSVRDLLAADIDDKQEAITLLNAYVHYIPADLQSKAKS